MDGFNFMVFPSCEKPCEYPHADAYERRSGSAQAYFTKEREIWSPPKSMGSRPLFQQTLDKT